MSLTGVRMAHAGKAEGWTPRFTRAAFVAEFGEGADISDVAVLTRILNGLGLDAAAVLTAECNLLFKFTEHVLRDWLAHVGVKTLFMKLGSP